MSFLDDPLLAMDGVLPGAELWEGDGTEDDDINVDLLAEAFFEAGGTVDSVGEVGLSVGTEEDVDRFLGTGTQASTGNIAPTTAMEGSVATFETQTLSLAEQEEEQQQQSMTTESPPPPIVSPVTQASPKGVDPETSELLPDPSVQPGAAAVTTASAWPSSFVAMDPVMSNTLMTQDPQQKGFIFPNINAIPMVNGEGMEQQQQQISILPNPFLAMAAGIPIVDRSQFIEAAFATRAKNRKRQAAMTQEQAERRRERNRVLAKKTRDRKKDHMGSLQEELLQLQKANAELKAMVRHNIDEKDSTRLLDECDAIDKVPSNVWEACGTDKKELAAEDFDMVSSIQKSQTAFVITDPSFDDNPIVFVSPDFLAMTGYKREQVIGRNCRFLQGTATDPDKVDQIRRGLALGEDVGVTLINYKADGTPFWNRLFIAAVRDVNDNIVNYMSVSVQVSRPEPGDPEHEKELPS